MANSETGPGLGHCKSPGTGPGLGGPLMPAGDPRAKLGPFVRFLWFLITDVPAHYETSETWHLKTYYTNFKGHTECDKLQNSNQLFNFEMSSISLVSPAAPGEPNAPLCPSAPQMERKPDQNFLQKDDLGHQAFRTKSFGPKVLVPKSPFHTLQVVV